jgi:proteasome-associated ATPase
MRRTPPAPLELPLLDDLLAVGEGAPTIDQKIELAKDIRSTRPDLARQLDAALFDSLARFRTGLEVAQETQRELRAILDRMAAPPWHPALFLRTVETDLGPRAMVLANGTRRVVGASDEIDLDALDVGEEVFLATEGNVITGRSPYGLPQYGETAFFERHMPDGRCVLRWRDEEVVVDAAAALRDTALETGDQVRWERAAWMAFEKIAGPSARRFLLDELPDMSRTQVGGQDANLDYLVSALTVTLVSPERAALYGLGGRQSILMEGPPGCGKTLMAKIAAAEVGRLGGKRCRFAVVKPGEWESPWVGETQMNIASTFRALKNFQDGFSVLFLDEIDAIGRIRGSAGNHHGDKFMTALLAELDGFADRAGIAIIAATNRKDLVDPALLERLSDVEIAVSRPDLRAARAIFGIHLPASLPLVAPREEIVETAVSRLYSPNGGNELCTLYFRDGKTRSVAARELASGRTFAQVCRSARLRAWARHGRHGAGGRRRDGPPRHHAHAAQRALLSLRSAAGRRRRSRRARRAEDEAPPVPPCLSRHDSRSSAEPTSSWGTSSWVPCVPTAPGARRRARCCARSAGTPGFPASTTRRTGDGSTSPPTAAASTSTSITSSAVCPRSAARTITWRRGTRCCA